MSRFADKLKNALQVAPPPMGFFRNVQPCSKPRMLLIASASLDEVEKSPDMFGGADAAVLTSPKFPAVRTLKAMAKLLNAVPVGLQIEADGANLKTLDNAGVDFIVFSPEKIPLSAICEEKPGRVVSIPLDIEDSLVRTLNELPVEAIVINTPASALLTFSDLMRFRRLGDWITKPLLAVVPLTLTEAEIKALWEAGIDALIVPLCAEDAGSFGELRAALDGLKLTTRRKWMKPHAIVPLVRQETASHAEEPPDEDDGDDE